MTKKICWSESFDGFTVAIVIKIPITDYGSGVYSEESSGCPKCNMWGSHGWYFSNNKRVLHEKFCSRCGGQRVIKKIDIDEDPVPFPDLREELDALQLNYAAFSDPSLEEDSGKWIVYAKELSYIGERGDWYGGIVYEFDNKIEKEISKVKEKYKKFIKKHNGKVSLAIVSDYFGW